MEPNEEQRARIEANRRRYEELKTAGQAPRALPPPTAVGDRPIAAGALIHRETVPGAWYWTTPLGRGEALRLVNSTGASSVALLAWNRHDRSERLNHADTVKTQWSATIRKGRVLLSDMGRVFLSVIEDTSFAHDALMGGSTAASTLARYGEGPFRNTRDNFIRAAGKLGLDRRDIAPCVTFFAPVTVDADGRFVWDAGKRRPGDFVDLRAEMDLDIAISNCPHPLDPQPSYAPGPIEAIRFRAPPRAADDLCATATSEAARAFENTDALRRA
jgi:uncharacterized protein